MNHTDPMKAGVQRVRVNDADLSVLVRGAGRGLLFLHGFPLDSRMWEGQMSVPGWRCLAPDLPGMGRSAVPGEGYSLALYADHLAALLKSLGHESAVVCGLSMGGYVAFELARRHPERVDGLVLLNTKASADDAAAKSGRDAMIRAALDRGPADVVEKLLPKLVSPSAPRFAEVSDRVRQMAADMPATGMVAALRAMRDRSDSTGTLGTLDFPTVVIASEDDVLTPPSLMLDMAAAIPGSKYHVVPRAGHLSPMEQPDIVAGLINDFLSHIA